ncbi:MAG: hypothetical protein LQ343_002681 [Gyalolechia ehrenbergii]|nr:MAG: hypothetical protein LQ343_002681 [Gyalolechia ehrenbergii]
MRPSPVSSLYLQLFCYVFFGSFLATLSASLKGHMNRASLASADIETLPSLLSQGAKNSTLQFDRCFIPIPGQRVVKTQDALIALGQLAMGQDFDDLKTSYSSGLLAQWKTASIQLLKYGQGYDVFAKHDLAIKAIVIFWHCVIQDPNRLGGVLRVGSRNVFAVVFQSPEFLHNPTSGGRKDG